MDQSGLCYSTNGNNRMGVTWLGKALYLLGQDVGHVRFGQGPTDVGKIYYWEEI